MEIFLCIVLLRTKVRRTLAIFSPRKWNVIVSRFLGLKIFTGFSVMPSYSRWRADFSLPISVISPWTNTCYNTNPDSNKQKGCTKNIKTLLLYLNIRHWLKLIFNIIINILIMLYSSISFYSFKYFLQYFLLGFAYYIRWMDAPYKMWGLLKVSMGWERNIFNRALHWETLPWHSLNIFRLFQDIFC